MSMEAWGAEDPADSLCVVGGCEQVAERDTLACLNHRNFVECDTCTEWVDLDAIISYRDDLEELNQCPLCFEDSNYHDECEDA